MGIERKHVVGLGEVSSDRTGTRVSFDFNMEGGGIERLELPHELLARLVVLIQTGGREAGSIRVSLGDKATQQLSYAFAVRQWTLGIASTHEAIRFVVEEGFPIELSMTKGRLEILGQDIERFLRTANPPQRQ